MKTEYKFFMRTFYYITDKYSCLSNYHGKSWYKIIPIKCFINYKKINKKVLMSQFSNHFYIKGVKIFSSQHQTPQEKRTSCLCFYGLCEMFRWMGGHFFIRRYSFNNNDYDVHKISLNKFILSLFYVHRKGCIHEEKNRRENKNNI